MTVGFSGQAPVAMRISSRAHYGLRMMTELAKSYGGPPLSLTEIARREVLPLAYLEQLVAPLRRSGLVEGTRGLHGGYRLARTPEQVTVLEIVELMEGEVAPVECLAEGYRSGSCEREPECLSRPLWGRLQQAVKQVLGGTTLRDLLSDPLAVEPWCPGEGMATAAFVKEAAHA
ncbi:MAG TPA: Rrf2 family transcriptional regulator [Candidatus Nanopelagicaceae bacterium]|nr:Rrf2 family transcriptional regulator [Candidatus Nanopelagicaceae bacterium]